MAVSYTHLVAHGVGTGCDSGFTHSQIFVYFQWIVTVGNVVHHLRIDADIVGCDVSGQLVHFFLPGEIRIFQAVDSVLAKTVVFRSGEHKTCLLYTSLEFECECVRSPLLFRCGSGDVGLKRKRKTERGKERSLKFCIESFGKAVRRVSELAVRRVDFCDFFAGFGKM